MVPRVIPGFLCGTSLLTILLLSYSSAGVELSINANTTDYRLPTRPGVNESLWCNVRNHSQEEELLWFRQDGMVDLKDGNRLNTSNICISPVTMDDNGVSFTCQLARDGSIQISVVLDVMFPPIISGEDPPSVLERNRVTLDCHVKANPPAQMVWYKDNSTLVLEASRLWISQTSELFQLVIERAQDSDSGVYTCEANSALGTARQDFLLTIEAGKLAFPMEAVIAAAVVVFLTILFAIVARREAIHKCLRKASKWPGNRAQ
ncbi:transmembrane and immunoglobulin domain-containing protein 1 [Eublepharis macularius]|uniref:transmembrane and immunoglobulin domain-containing protein 1 n=1 Tax=Eublepharis macularius TaxID=481883 RepID=UPI00241042C5|nr:transmembrane and immunoglobulin domain-containing protein 1 [Eublepharis macularius]XP_054857443.1 transmembrane and immunoglobulin domain-containing protein 1 [Eublepharis macularius]XP_054857444.1 transmembrane and immunoglobulin domain-containing protein 1 [Eublepharis macularius]